MPKHKKSGKKKPSSGQSRRELVAKEHGQEYARVIKLLGNCRMTAMCDDGLERLCIIRGKMRNREWIRPDDIILIGLRDFQDGKGDVIHKYTSDEVRTLKKLGQITEAILNGHRSDMDGKDVSELPEEDDTFIFEDL